MNIADEYQNWIEENKSELESDFCEDNDKFNAYCMEQCDHAFAR